MAEGSYKVCPPKPDHEVKGLMEDKRFSDELHKRMLAAHKAYMNSKYADDPKAPKVLATACLILSSHGLDQETIWYFGFYSGSYVADPVTHTMRYNPREIIEAMNWGVFLCGFTEAPQVSELPIHVIDVGIDPNWNDFSVDQFLQGYFGESVVSQCDYIKTKNSDVT